MQSYTNKRDKEKRTISTEFSKCLKTIQQDHMGSDEPIYSNDTANNLCNILEAVFLHGLKTTASKKLTSYLKGQSPKPTKTYVTFWNYVKKFSHRDVVAQLQHLGQITTEIGLCRAWVRLALNDGIMESYIDTMQSDAATLEHYYEYWAYLQDLEQPDILKSYLQGLAEFQFKLSYNSSVLNMWTNVPLILAGIIDNHTPPPFVPSAGVQSHQQHAPESSPIKVKHKSASRRQTSIETGCDASTYNFGGVPTTPNNTPEGIFTRQNTEDIKRMAMLVQSSPDASTSSQISCPDPPLARYTEGIREEFGSVSSHGSTASFTTADGSVNQFAELETKQDHNVLKTHEEIGDDKTGVSDKTAADNTHGGKGGAELYQDGQNGLVKNSNTIIADETLDRDSVSKVKNSNRVKRDAKDILGSELKDSEENKDKVLVTNDQNLNLHTEKDESHPADHHEKSNVKSELKAKQSDNIGKLSGVFEPLKAAADEKIGAMCNEDVYSVSLSETESKMEHTSADGVDLHRRTDSKKGSKLLDDSVGIRNDDETVTVIRRHPSESDTDTSQMFGNRLGSKIGWSSTFDVRDGDASSQLLERQDIPEATRDVSYGSMLQTYEPAAGFQTTTTVQQLIDDLPRTPTSSHVITAAQEKAYETQLAIISTICHEKGLKAQNFQCYKCQRPIGFFYGKPRVCTFDGGYYCKECHENEEVIIPSKVLYSWDFTKYKVAKHNRNFLIEVDEHPLLNVEQLNSKLYTHVQELNDVKALRVQLLHLKSYMFTCQMSVAEEWRKLVWPKEYLYDGIHLYSLSDLSLVSSGLLAQNLRRIIKFGVKHVYECRLCSQKGFICELCHNPKVIYPFQTDSTYRCRHCHSVYHKLCKTDIKPCPKCQRRMRRRSLISEDNSSIDTIDYACSPIKTV